MAIDRSRTLASFSKIVLAIALVLPALKAQAFAAVYVDGSAWTRCSSSGGVPIDDGTRYVGCSYSFSEGFGGGGSSSGYTSGGGSGGGFISTPSVTVDSRDPGVKELCPKGGAGSAPTTVGNPIVLATGNKIERELDFLRDGEADLFLSRTYNHYWAGVGLFGKHWVSNFDYKLTFGTTAINSCYPRPGGGWCTIGTDTVIYAWRPDGRVIKFVKDFDEDLFYEDKAQPVARIERRPDGSFILYNEANGSELYAAQGYLIQVTNPYGGWTAIRYGSASGYPTATATYPVLIMAGPRKGSAELTWANGQLTGVKDPAGNLYSYTYSANAFGAGLHRLATVSKPGNPATTVTYHHEIAERPGALTGKSINNVRYSTFSYDSNGYATSTEHNGLEKYSLIYTRGTDGKLTVEETNPLGKKTIYEFVNGNATTITGYPSSHCPSMTNALTEYDSNGYPAMRTDFRGNKTAFVYNAKGQLTKQIDAYGTSVARETVYEFDSSANRILSVTLTGQLRTAYTYDADGRVASITHANLSAVGLNLPQTTTYEYKYNVDPLSGERAGLYQVIEDGPIAGTGDRVVRTFGWNGELLSAENGLGHKVTYGNHDVMNRPGRVTGANGDVVDFVYDPRGRMTEVKTYRNGATQTIQYAYDGFERLATVMRPDGVKHGYQYDVSGRVLLEYETESGGTFAQISTTYNAMSLPTAVTTGRVASEPASGTLAPATP